MGSVISPRVIVPEKRFGLKMYLIGFWLEPFVALVFKRHVQGYHTQ